MIIYPLQHHTQCFIYYFKNVCFTCSYIGTSCFIRLKQQTCIIENTHIICTTACCTASIMLLNDVPDLLGEIDKNITQKKECYCKYVQYIFSEKIRPAGSQHQSATLFRTSCAIDWFLSNPNIKLKDTRRTPRIKNLCQVFLTLLCVSLFLLRTKTALSTATRPTLALGSPVTMRWNSSPGSNTFLTFKLSFTSSLSYIT